jgi:cobalamin biosynthesis Mg chelatase CobN
LYKKPCINITVYENAMGNKTLKVMREMVNNAGGYVVGALAIKCAYDKEPINESNNKKINNIVKLFINKLRKNNPPIISRIYTTIVVKIVLKSFVYKQKERYTGIINSWKEKKIIKT